MSRSARLGFDEGCAGFAVDEAIGSARVAGDRHGHLSSPTQCWMEALSEPIKEREMSPITYRVAVRI